MKTRKALYGGVQAAVLIFAVLAVSNLAVAQSNAILDVAVFDPGRVPVADATVSLQGSSPARAAEAPRNAGGGRYHFEAAPGTYRLIITHPSLRRAERTVELGAGQRREITVTLQLEPLAQNVLVSAEPVAISAAESTQNASVIGGKEIERRQAAGISAVLSLQPGITVAQADAGGGITSLFLEGGNSNFTKVLVDGVPLNEPGGAIDLSNFTLENVDKIEVLRGAQSALTGSDAMTGAVEVLTHRGTTRTPQLLLQADGGSLQTGHGTARASGMAGPLDYSAAAGYFSTAGREPNGRYLNRTLSGNFGLRLNEHNSLRWTIRNNTSDAGAAGQTDFTPPNRDQHNALRDFTSGLTWEGESGRHWQNRISGWETYIRQLFENPLSDFFTAPDPFGSCAFPRSAAAVPSAYCDVPYRSANQLNRAGFVAQSSYLLRRGAVTGGYFYEAENAFLSALGGGHARRNNQAGFVAGRWEPQQRVVINAGFRVEDNASFGTKIVPRAGLAFTARSGGEHFGPTRLRFSYGEGIKEPRLDQSFGADLCTPGNPNLRPEQSRTISAGAEQEIGGGRLRVSADYFDNRFRDIVSFAFCFPGGPCPVTPPSGCGFGFGSYFNTDLARARGTTIAAEARAGSHVSITANYTLDATRVLVSPNAFDPAQQPGNRLLRRPVHSGNIGVNGGAGRLEATVIARFTGRRTDSDFLFPPLGLTSNPGFAVVSVAGSFRINRQAAAIARVENLLDKKYQEVLGYPAFGRAAYAGLRLTFGGE